VAYAYEQEDLDQLPQYGDAFFQQSHFIGEHVDKTHGEKFLGIEIGSSTFHTLLPNLTEQ
jgi:hypothetical protein